MKHAVSALTRSWATSLNLPAFAAAELHHAIVSTFEGLRCTEHLVALASGSLPVPQNELMPTSCPRAFAEKPWVLQWSCLDCLPLASSVIRACIYPVPDKALPCIFLIQCCRCWAMFWPAPGPKLGTCSTLAPQRRKSKLWPVTQWSVGISYPAQLKVLPPVIQMLRAVAG